jgi:AraC-like DNA-binding protein/quercetin dioxygenase-like cupin family protein
LRCTVQELLPRSTPIFDPQVLRLWALLRDIPARIGRVHRIGAARSRAWEGECHAHTTPTWVVCLEGVLRIETGATSALDLNVGDAAVIAAGAWHHHSGLVRGAASYGQGFMLGASDVRMATRERGWWMTVPLQPSRELIAAMLVAAEARRSRLARELLAHVTDTCATPVEPMSPPVRRMWSFLCTHRHRPVSAADVVQASGLGLSRAHALFKGYFRETPKQALLRSRLELARQLLAEGVMIADIAARSGFRGRADFTRSFRRAFGHPPSRWRSSEG